MDCVAFTTCEGTHDAMSPWRRRATSTSVLITVSIGIGGVSRSSAPRQRGMAPGRHLLALLQHDPIDVRVIERRHVVSGGADRLAFGQALVALRLHSDNGPSQVPGQARTAKSAGALGEPIAPPSRQQRVGLTGQVENVVRITSAVSSPTPRA